MHEGRETDGLLGPTGNFAKYDQNCSVDLAGFDATGRQDSAEHHGRIFLHHGEINIQRRFSGISYLKKSFSSIFHALAYMPTCKCVMTLVGIYVGIIFFYGVMWTIIGVTSPSCNLEIHDILEGCLFSLE